MGIRFQESSKVKLLESQVKSPEKSTQTAKLLETPKKMCIKCKNTEGTCDFLVSYQSYFNKWENPLQSNLLKAICENCQAFFKMCNENGTLKKDLELTKENEEKLLKLKELKINSFSLDIKKLDKKKLSDFDLNFLKKHAETPPKSYCEKSDEIKRLMKDLKELRAKVNVQDSEGNEKLKKENEELRAKLKLDENKKLKKEIEELKA